MFRTFWPLAQASPFRHVVSEEITWSSIRYHKTPPPPPPPLDPPHRLTQHYRVSRERTHIHAHASHPVSHTHSLPSHLPTVSAASRVALLHSPSCMHLLSEDNLFFSLPKAAPTAKSPDRKEKRRKEREKKKREIKILTASAASRHMSHYFRRSMYVLYICQNPLDLA